MAKTKTYWTREQTRMMTHRDIGWRIVRYLETHDGNESIVNLTRIMDVDPRRLYNAIRKLNKVLEAYTGPDGYEDFRVRLCSGKTVKGCDRPVNRHRELANKLYSMGVRL